MRAPTPGKGPHALLCSSHDMGRGVRVGSNIPKHFIHVNDESVIAYMMQVYQCHPSVEGIAVACLAQADDLVVIHNGNQALISRDVISDAISTGAREGSAVTAISALRSLSSGTLVMEPLCCETIWRESLRRAQTSHAMRLGELRSCRRGGLGSAVGAHGALRDGRSPVHGRRDELQDNDPERPGDLPGASRERQEGIGNMAGRLDSELYQKELDSVCKQDLPWEELAGRTVATVKGSAVTAIPCTEVIARRDIDDETLCHETIRRESLARTQTPHVMKYGELISLHEKAMRDGVDSAALPELMVRYGMEVYLTPGNEKNFKITTPSDLEIFRALVEQEARG